MNTEDIMPADMFIKIAGELQSIDLSLPLPTIFNCENGVNCIDIEKVDTGMVIKLDCSYKHKRRLPRKIKKKLKKIGIHINLYGCL